MAQSFVSAVGRTFFRFAHARTRTYTLVDEGAVSQSALDADISLAACSNVSVLVTAESLDAARRVACAIQDRLESRSVPVGIIDCAVADDSLVELLDNCTGAAILEDIGSLGDQGQALLYGFLENRLDGPSSRTDQVQIISTALTDLYASVKAGKFREALFYRLNLIHISMSRATAVEPF